jgi:hypothetical protein
MKCLISIFLVLLFVSCNYPLFNSTEEEKPTVAISSFFSPDSVIRVKVTPVIDAFTDSSETLDVKEVKVTNQKTGQVAYLEKEDGSESVYTTAQFVPALGDVLKLEVQTNASDEPIVAVDSICATVVPFQLVSTGVNVQDYSEGNSFECSIYRTAIIRFLPVGSENPHYYELVVFTADYDYNYSEKIIKRGPEYQASLTSSTSIVTSEDYYPSKTLIGASHPKSLLFKSTSVKDSVSIDFSYVTSTSGSASGWTSCAHDLRIELRRVSYAYYKYKTALYKQKNAVKGDIIYGGSPPVMIPTNVENGTGVFAGYNATECKAYIDEYLYKRQN